MSAPSAPWHLEGEAIVAFARAPGIRSEHRAPTSRRLPGPVTVGAVHYTRSPVGAYLELSVSEPAWLRRRPGFAITTMVVDSPASRMGGQTNWGFPKEMGVLRWHADAVERELVWEDRGLSVRARARSWGMPAWVPVRAIQHLPDGDVLVPGRLWGWLAPARVEIGVPDGDALVDLCGRHPGIVLTSFRFVVHAPRLPATAAVLNPSPLVEPS
jgi:hypothetical protein